jgi:hypothetical protein
LALVLEVSCPRLGGILPSLEVLEHEVDSDSLLDLFRGYFVAGDRRSHRCFWWSTIRG